MEHSRLERSSTAMAKVARSFGMAVAVVAALLLGVVAAAYARGGIDTADSTPLPSDPSVR